MKLDKKIFKENFAILTENFGFQVSPAYLKMIFNTLENQITDEKLQAATMKILQEVTMDAWNKKYGFNGKPAIADWLEFFSGKKKRLTITGTFPIPILFPSR